MSGKNMKTWQHNYEIDYLKSIETLYQNYNQYSDSPFSEYKKNNIAQDLHEKKLFLEEEGSYRASTVQKKSPITMYQDVVIGNKLPGDHVVSHIRGTDKYIEELFFRISFWESTWLYVWAEDTRIKNLIPKQHFTYVGSKITTFGEIYEIYFHNSSVSLDDRTHPKIDETENVTIKKLTDVNLHTIMSIKGTLERLDLNFQNHYSNYNKKKSWSAISLRGYSPDIMRIEKPIEMNKKWKEEHRDEELFLQDTVLRKNFPEVESLLKLFGDTNVHRIRFMRLSPGGGELTRHTDQVDPDSGGSLGKLARIHIPIETNPNVEFMVWEPNGNKKVVNMRIGECWFLDTRKPHMVINNGDKERIHLVIDVETDNKLREMILA
jgi:hypothetical protein